MEPRFGKTNEATKHVPALKAGGVTVYRAYEFHYSITEYNLSQCYINPESYKWGANCPNSPWVVSFDASKSVGTNFEWTVRRGSCDSLVKSKITCTFPELGEYTIALKVSEKEGGSAIERQQITLKDLLIVSLGDSVGSGEGVPDVSRSVVGHATIPLVGTSISVYSPVVWSDRRCHRSAHAGSARAAKDIEEADPHTSVTFVHLACSGAGIENGMLDYYVGQEPERFTCSHGANGYNSCSGRAKPHFCTLSVCTRLLQPQVDMVAQLLCPTQLPMDSRGRVIKPCAAEGMRKIDVLMISVGANDVEFGDVVKACMVFENCHLRRTTHTSWNHKTNEFVRVLQRVDNNIEGLQSKFRKLHEAIGEKLPVQPAAVFVTEYFDPTHDGDKFCNRDGGDAAKIAVTETGHNYLVLGVADAVDPVIDFDGLKHDEYEWAYKSIVKPMNDQVEAAAKEFGWIFVGGIQNAFRKHGLCADDNWVNGLEASFQRQADYTGTM